MNVSPLRRRVRQLIVLGLSAVCLTLDMPDAFSQQATTDWSPFSDNSLSELRPANLPPSFAPLAVTAADQARQPSWIIRPSITIGESYTTNAEGAGGGSKGELFTTIAPDLFVSGQSSRLRGMLNVAPQFLYYPADTHFDQLTASATSTGTAIIIPDRLFLDEQASLGAVDRTGFRGLDNTTVIPETNLTQQIMYTVSPFAYVPFSSDTDLEARYRFSQLMFSGNTGAVVSPLTGQSLAPISNATMNEAFAKLKTTGISDLALFSVTADDNIFSEPGTQFSQDNITGVLGASYLVMHGLWATADAGYEDLTFPQLSRLNYLGPTWEAGFRYAPSPDRIASLEYGSWEGHLGFKGYLNYAVTPSLSVFAKYSEQIATPQQQMLQDLPLVNQTVPGTTIDATTGLPIDLGNPSLPAANGIFFAKTLTGGATDIIDLNTITLRFNVAHDEALAGPSPTESTMGASFAFSRSLSPKLSGTAVVGYSMISLSALGATPATKGNVITGGLSLSYSFTETLQGRASYAVQYDYGTFPSALVNIVTVALTKSF